MNQTPIPAPPFYGSKVVTDISLEQVYNYINPVVLFRVQWKYRRQPGMSQHEYDRFIEREIVPIYQHYRMLCADNAWLRPLVVYGYFHAQSDGDDLIIYHDDAQTEWVRFTFPRQTHTEERRCITDYFVGLDSGRTDVVAFQLVTVGDTITEVAQASLEAGNEGRYLHLRGLGVETTEALAEYAHRQIRLELDIAEADSPYVLDLFHGSYQGARFSFGDAAGPNSADLTKLWQLLEPERIGVELSEGFQLAPEESTAAIIVHHPEARLFNVK
ncbi:MAG: hypothetical protein O7E52_14100 [Candidatus Poribacteria bacterium]|nr:hypothetical protein [Candidatus Poribacteria bacterium]